MMKSKVLIALAAAFVLAIPSMAVAQVPAEVPVQGFLTDDQGVPVDGSVSVEFTIYDAAVSGTEVHTQTETVGADAGAFSVYLTPDLAIFENNSELYLGMAVDGAAEMSPRLKMGSVPYAAVAGNASTLEGMSAADFAPSSYTPAWSDITGVPADIADGDDDTTTPDWSDIQNVPADIADGDADTDTTYTASGAISIDASNNITLNSSCTSGQVLKWDGSAWACADDEDADTTYSAAAGGGLSLNGTEFSIASGGVTNSHLNGAISPTKISGQAATLAGGAAFNGDVSATGFSYDSSVTRIESLPATAFVRDEEANWNLAPRRGHYYSSGTAVSGYVVAPLQLPDGATITEMHCYGYDSDTAEDITVRSRIIKSNMFNGQSGAFTELSQEEIVTTGSSTNVQIVTTSGLSIPVDNNDDAYQIQVFLDPTAASADLRFYGCKTYYTVDTPAP